MKTLFFAAILSPLACLTARGACVINVSGTKVMDEIQSPNGEIAIPAVWGFSGVTLTASGCVGPFEWRDAKSATLGALGTGSSVFTNASSRFADTGPQQLSYTLSTGEGTVGINVRYGRNHSVPNLQLGACYKDEETLRGRLRDFTLTVQDPDPSGESETLPIAQALAIDSSGVETNPPNGVSETVTGTLSLAKGNRLLAYSSTNMYKATQTADGYVVMRIANQQVSCPDTPPQITLENDKIVTDNFSQISISATVSDAEYDPFVRINWAIVEKPAGSNATIAATTTGLQNDLHADVPGIYRVSAKAYDGTSYGNIDEIEIDVQKFKVTLFSDNKEYLIKDCAPFNHACKAPSELQYTGGEFLFKDKVSFDAGASGGSSGASYAWTVEKEGVIFEDVITTASKHAFTFEEVGDFNVRLVITRNGIEGPPLTKKIKVRNEIEMGFSENPGPGEYREFYQGPYNDSANDWHKNAGAGELISNAGCAVTVATTMGSLMGGSIPAPGPNEPPYETTGFDVPSVNEFLTRRGVFDNESNLDFGSGLVRALNEMPSGNGLELHTPTGEWPSKTRLQLEQLARRRKIVVLRVHTRKHSPTDPKHPGHPSHKHFILLRGIGWDPGLNRQVLLVQDPGWAGDDKTKSFDHPRLGAVGFKGYDGSVAADSLMGVNVYTLLEAHQRRVAPSDSMEIILSDIDRNYLLENPLGQKLGVNLNSGAPIQEINGAIYEEDGLASDNDTSQGGAIYSYKKMSFGEGVPPGLYKIFAKIPHGKSSKVTVSVRDSLGSRKAHKFLTLKGDSTGNALAQFVISDDEMEVGNLAISGRRYETKSSKSPGYFELRGALSPLPMNILSSDIAISLGGIEGDSIPAGSLQQFGDTLFYYSRAENNGVYYFGLKSSGEFVLKARGITEMQLNRPTQILVRIGIGNSSFEGYVSRQSSKLKPLIELVPEKLAYEVGEMLKVRAVPAQLPAVESGQQYWIELFFNGLPIGSAYSNNNEWKIELPVKNQGAHIISADLYLQDARAAAAIEAALEKYFAERSSINTRLGDNIEESEREALQKRLEEIVSLENELKKGRSKVRKKIGSAEEMEIYAQ